MAQSRINTQLLDQGALPAKVSISSFHGENGVSEHHIMVCPTEYESFETQLDWVYRAYHRVPDSVGLDMDTGVVRRLFCSDLQNQADALQTSPFAPDNRSAATSLVGQPPVSPARLALWAYHIDDPNNPLEKSRDGMSVSVKRGDLSHIWTIGMTCPEESASYDQTMRIFGEYNDFLRISGLHLSDHVIRTWLYVRDVDVNYQGLVDARREFFAEHGLTQDTHYIASTGIEGRTSDIDAKVMMDAYAISGIRPEQIHFLADENYLSPTNIYGVTFERGVSVSYQDRKHILISGTASIDHAGRILHEGNVTRQLDRTLENIEALLRKADAGLDDVGMFIVYVRDHCDLETSQRLMEERFEGTPIQTVVAPVCRPGWLIEIECQAIIPAHNPTLPCF